MACCCGGKDAGGLGGLGNPGPIDSIGSGAAPAAMTRGSEAGKQRPSKSSVTSRGHIHCAQRRGIFGLKTWDEKSHGMVSLLCCVWQRKMCGERQG